MYGIQSGTAPRRGWQCRSITSSGARSISTTMKEFLEMTDPRYVYYCLDTAQVAIMGKDILHFMIISRQSPVFPY